ncbi:PGPGW domain-containing protein [Geodermatophilus ruber]|uniref:Putative transmembrane protein (PGPGW) n=1 Tax=Geodermatophilus ruber TaxID=504800 RepID=A0A1I4EZR9_9ACTN|nr:PGPGW domain-containing protein [Geodermatophilus ruber]SFL10703.1 Putative transmembrane protein (PGPGW) [Geodermatophilus ruber]
MDRTSGAAPPSTVSSGRPTRCPNCRDGLGAARPVRPGCWRDRIRRRPVLGTVYRIAVFVIGLLFVLLGAALSVLPGPLTVPPVLVGLWVWSTEFDWARRFLAAFGRNARDAWAHARQHPVSSTAMTLGGLAAIGVVIWAAGRYDLLDRITAGVDG